MYFWPGLPKVIWWSTQTHMFLGKIWSQMRKSSSQLSKNWGWEPLLIKFMSMWSSSCIGLGQEAKLGSTAARLPLKHSEKSYDIGIDWAEQLAFISPIRSTELPNLPFAQVVSSVSKLGRFGALSRFSAGMPKGVITLVKLPFAESTRMLVLLCPLPQVSWLRNSI